MPCPAGEVRESNDLSEEDQRRHDLICKFTESQKKSGEDAADAFGESFLNPEFFAKHWEKLPLHHRASAESQGNRANSLTDLVKVDDVFGTFFLAGDNLKMFRKGEVYDGEENFAAAYLDGATLILNQADRSVPTLSGFCRRLGAKHFGHTFGVLYLTPPQSHAVRLHSDDQDVFLCQLWGRKSWTIRGPPPIRLPYTEEMLGKNTPVPDDLQGNPIMTFIMEPGDVLYIPRGFLHEACTGTELSLHCTITVPTSDYCYGVQFVRLFTEMLNSPDLPSELRKTADIPLAVKNGAVELDDNTINSHIDDLLQAWINEVNTESLKSSFLSRISHVNANQKSATADVLKRRCHLAPWVKEVDSIRLMYGVKCSCKQGPEIVVFQRNGKYLRMPIARTSYQLFQSLSSTPQRVLDLPCDDPFERICVLNCLHQNDLVQVFLNPKVHLHG